MFERMRFPIWLIFIIFPFSKWRILFHHMKYPPNQRYRYVHFSFSPIWFCVNFHCFLVFQDGGSYGGMSSSLRETTTFFELSLLLHEAAAIFVLLSTPALGPGPALQTSTQFAALFCSEELLMATENLSSAFVQTKSPANCNGWKTYPSALDLFWKRAKQLLPDPHTQQASFRTLQIVLRSQKWECFQTCLVICNSRATSQCLTCSRLYSLNRWHQKLIANRQVIPHKCSKWFLCRWTGGPSCSATSEKKTCRGEGEILLNKYHREALVVDEEDNADLDSKFWTTKKENIPKEMECLWEKQKNKIFTLLVRIVTSGMHPK